jgi:hypothetical protein
MLKNKTHSRGISISGELHISKALASIDNAGVELSQLSAADHYQLMQLCDKFKKYSPDWKLVEYPFSLLSSLGCMLEQDRET